MGSRGSNKALGPARDNWIAIKPKLVADPAANRQFRQVSRRLMRVGNNGTRAQTIATIRGEECDRALGQRATWAAELVLAINVLCDLRAQGWLLRIIRSGVAALPPLPNVGSVDEEKDRVRVAHLIERDAQLRQPAVRRFIAGMERRRPFRDEWHSIFSLMRDGRKLATAAATASKLPLAERGLELQKLIDPYVQVVMPNVTCEHTGLLLSEIWRYFRHTWTTTYQSTPGRKIYLLIRDRAAPHHPVIGIGALGSPVVQLSVRDEWIGWTGPRLIAEMRASPTALWARWLDRSLHELIDGVMVSDFTREGILPRNSIAEPTADIVARLIELSKAERAVHHLYPARGLHKKASGAEHPQDWGAQATTHLFRSKRAKALAELLEARRRLQVAGFRQPVAAQLKRALTNGPAVRAIHSVLRRVKATHVGIHMMDITVCGAIAPYNHLIGGKLVALLMASPTVVRAYNRRYQQANSVIASSMAGHPVKRKPRLVLLGTTSLYGAGASQYNRCWIPVEALGGCPGRKLSYEPLGKTLGYGSFHFSAETMTAIDPVLRRLQRGRPVNSIFGEGVNPKLRKVRAALDTVGLPSDLLLQHGSPRIVYAVPLAANFRDVLIGRSKRPTYILPDDDATIDRVARYWRKRWLSQRIERPDVLRQVATHTTAHPVTHGARVELPRLTDDPDSLFGSVHRDSRSDGTAGRRQLDTGITPRVGRAPKGGG